MALEIQVGDPPESGRYVVYLACRPVQIREWCEPSIATWYGGKWHTYETVWGWIGPLPVVHGNDCLEKIATAQCRHGYSLNAHEICPRCEIEMREYDL